MKKAYKFMEDHMDFKKRTEILIHLYLILRYM